MTPEINEIEPVAVELLPETARFVELVARGYDPGDAAQLAGFQREDARGLVRHPRVQDAIHNEARGLAKGRLLPLALRALTRLMEDPTTPPVLLARVAAQVLAQGGILAPDARSAPATPQSPDALPINDMTPDQLAAAKRDINTLLRIETVDAKAKVSR